LSFDFEEEFDFKLKTSAAKEKSFKRTDPRRSSWKGSFVKKGRTNRQKVIVKSYISSGKNPSGGMRKHTDYLIRDGVGKENESAVPFFSHLYADENAKSGDEKCKSDHEVFLERAKKDAHHFRFMVSPENGHTMDLSSYTYDLMEKLSVDLKADIEWMAVEHHDTDQSHVHIVVRGHDLRRNKPLYIHPKYMHQWMRNRAEKVATKTLGPRLKEQVALGKSKEVVAERFTKIDKNLIETQKTDGVVTLSNDDLLTRKRLQYLRSQNLAVEIKRNSWILHAHLEGRLRDKGRSNDVIRTMISSRYGTKSMLDSGGYLNEVPRNRTSIVLSTGQANEVTDERFALLECSDGRLYYATSKQTLLPNGLKGGDVVRFDVESSATKEGHWKTVAVVLDSTSIEIQVSKKGKTWLDSLTETDLLKTKGTFGVAVKSAWKERQMFLFEHGIESVDPEVRIKRALGLRFQSLVSAIKTRTDKRFVENPNRFTGNLTSNHGDYSVVENANEFTLVHSTSYLNRSNFRQVEVSLASDGLTQKVFVQPTSVCPVTLEQARDDLNYTGPTWLDRQLVYPSDVVAPEILSHIESLKSARESVLLTNKIVNSRDEIGTDLIKRTREWERDNFISDIKRESSSTYLDPKGFEGVVSKPIKLRGGTYLVVANNKSFTVVPSDKNLKEHIGKRVTLSQQTDKNRRTRVTAKPAEERKR